MFPTTDKPKVAALQGALNAHLTRRKLPPLGADGVYGATSANVTAWLSPKLFNAPSIDDALAQVRAYSGEPTMADVPTKADVIAVQRKIGLPAHGDLGVRTWNAISAKFGAQTTWWLLPFAEVRAAVLANRPLSIATLPAGITVMDPNANMEPPAPFLPQTGTVVAMSAEPLVGPGGMPPKKPPAQVWLVDAKKPKPRKPVPQGPGTTVSKAPPKPQPVGPAKAAAVSPPAGTSEAAAIPLWKKAGVGLLGAWVIWKLWRSYQSA